jgi:threonine dehydrogenase-like Zn-dependent dehydrogenase
MLALVLDGSVSLRSDHPAPLRAPGEARVSVHTAGICDTDLQLSRGYMGYRGVLGHEFVGRVVEADHAELVGQRVVADINAGCGTCPECIERGGHHCSRRTVLGIVGRDGALAEELTIPERCLVPVPASVDDTRAVFAEPLAAALHVLDEMAGHTRALVVGDGKLGLLITLGLEAAGVEVTLVGHHRDKLALARAAGAETALESELGTARWPLVVEATGSASGLETALGAAQPRARVVLKTTIAGPTSVDLSPVVVNELRVVGSRCGDLRRAIAVLAQGTVDPTPLVSARYPLAEAERALAHAGQKGVLKVLVDVVPPSQRDSSRQI